MTGTILGLGRIGCSAVAARMADYLDGRLTGKEMQRIAVHLSGCAACASEMESEQAMLRSLASLTSPKAPDNLSLRIRVALSQELAQRNRSRVAQWKLVWQNTIGPVLFRASAGLASAVLLLATVSLLVGLFARPMAASAQDEPLGARTAPRFLYESRVDADVAEIGTDSGPVVIEAYVNGQGRAYDYRIVSGPSDAKTRSEIENLLLFSVFEPARYYGQPVRGLAVLSFTGVAVHG